MAMINAVSGLGTEFRMTPRLVIAALVVSGLVSVFASDLQADPSDRLNILLYALLLYTTSATVWVLDHRNPQLGRWFTIIALIVLISLGLGWLGIPGFLSLMVLPAALAAALINFPAAVVTAAGETILLLLLPKFVSIDANSTTIITVLITIWTTLGAIFSVYRPMYHMTRWSWEHFQRAQALLEDARDRAAKLEQALDDLAHANRQLGLLNERVAAMRLIAEEAQKTKAAFVAKVSHEFRTPLNMIIGLTNLLVETPEVYGEALSPALLEDLAIVHRNCEHLSSMINDVLDLSQTEAGHLVLHREWVDLAEVIDSALVVVRPLLEKKKLRLKVTVPDNLPKVYCDKTRIRQVILNLVSNAARFTEEGGIASQVRTENQHVVISITDTGPGIPPGDAARIFEPFYQGMSNVWHSQNGSGLGLSISKQFVELHGGRIWLESQPGIGSTFYVELPISPPEAPVARPGHWVREDWVWTTERMRQPAPPRLPFQERVIVCDETGELYPLFVQLSDKIEFVNTRNLGMVQKAA